MHIDPQEKIKELASGIADEKGFILVDIEIKGSAGNTEVWVSVDAEDRFLNLDDYAEMSNELSFLMEAHEIFENKYRLNVSSPGLSKPLVDKRQYSKNKGKTAKVKYKRGDFAKAKGIITDVNEDGIILTTDKGEELSLTFEEIVETKIIPVF